MQYLSYIYQFFISFLGKDRIRDQDQDPVAEKADQDLRNIHQREDPPLGAPGGLHPQEGHHPQEEEPSLPVIGPSPKAGLHPEAEAVLQKTEVGAQSDQ